MNTSSLPISLLIAVGVILTPAGAQTQSLSNLLVLGTSTVIDPTECQRIYPSLSAVAQDFGTACEEYYAAALWFEQTPTPTQINIGRWVKTASAGGLRGAPLSATAQAIATWNAITTGSFTVSVDGTPQNVTALSFAGAANLNAVAADITAKLTGATCVWNASFGRFEFTSDTTGDTSAVSFLTTEGTGTDISAMLGGTAASSGAYIYAGQIAETAVAAAALFDNQYGQQFYGLVIPSAADADHEAVAPFIEGANNKHIYGVTTQEAGVLVAATTTDIASVLQAAKYTRTIVQYSSTSAYAVCSALSRLLGVNYLGNNTTITLMYKQEPGVVPETLNATQLQALTGKNCNVIVNYNNNTAILQNGIMSGGVFADIITGTDWLVVTIQTQLYNLFYTSTTKVPQTDKGQQLLNTTAEAVCQQGVVNGLLAPGVWNSGGFGILNQGDFLPKGFYVYAAPFATQQQNLRTARQAMPIQIAAKLAGAIHDIAVTITVNQ